MGGDNLTNPLWLISIEVKIDKALALVLLIAHGCAPFQLAPLRSLTDRPKSRLTLLIDIHKTYAQCPVEAGMAK